MRSIAIFLLLIFVVNIGSTMALTIGVVTQDEIAIEIINIDSIEEEENSTSPKSCCETEEEDNKKGCCTDDCDCNCCHHLTITTSQIISKIYEIQLNNSISFSMKNDFLYECLYGNDANASIFQPPQLYS